MKTYFVVWFYVSNYKLLAVEARDVADARELATGFYGKEFHDKATVLVFDEPPAFFIDPANNISAASKRVLEREIYNHNIACEACERSTPGLGCGDCRAGK